MNTFQLTIVAYNKLVFDGPARFCSVMTPGGSIGLEAHHENFLAVLKENSKISYRNAEGRDGSVKAESGLLSFENNTCTITIELSDNAGRR